MNYGLIHFGRWILLIILLVIAVSLFFLFDALLEKHFPEHFFLFLIRIVVLDIVVRWLVEDKVTIMVTIRVLVSNPPVLLLVGAAAAMAPLLAYLRSQKQDSLVETTNHWYFHHLLILLLLGS